MDVDDYRQLRLLTEISSGGSVTQRRLAKKHGLALGLTNFLIRRLVKKGCVKIVNLERKRLRYLITPKGLAEKARLTYDYLEYSLALYRHVRVLLTQTLSVLLRSGGTQAVLCGTGELAEIALQVMQEHGLSIVAVIDDGRNGKTTLMNQPVRHPSALRTLSFDWVVIASFTDPSRVIQQLEQVGVEPEKVVTISERSGASALTAPTPMMEALRA
ncbi:MAG: winged helix-turn-helix transcriptional regulator [Candidatus Omnitrophica bacterium]|nr:winged helix-turn-helix transcriptional regulator [Candidatus Omnitrophota bacterium]